MTDGPSDAYPDLEPDVNVLTLGDATLTIAETLLGPFPRGAALVLCDRSHFGDMRSLMNALAEHGFESLAADISAQRNALDPVNGPVSVLLDRLAQRSWDHEQIGIIGYGPGGQAAIQAAATYALGAAVSVSVLPTPEQIDALAGPLGTLRTPWLGLTSTPATAATNAALQRLNEIRRLRTPVHTDVVCYRRLPESFHLDVTDASDHAAAFDIWQRVIEWLNSRVVPRLTPRSLAWRAHLSADATVL